MKKRFVTLALALGLCAMNAQEKKEGIDIDFGAKAGLSVSDIVVSDSFNQLEDRAGFYAGVFAEIDLSEKFQIQPELLFSLEGGTLANGLGGDDDNASLAYLRLPVLAKYNFYKGFDLQVGPQVGFKVAEGDGFTDDSDINTFDFGFIGGIGYEFDSGFGVEARYLRGITEISDNSDAYNHSFQFGVSYEF